MAQTILCNKPCTSEFSEWPCHNIKELCAIKSEQQTSLLSVSSSPPLFFRTDCFVEVRNEHVVWHEAFLEAKVIGSGLCVTRSMKMWGVNFYKYFWDLEFWKYHIGLLQIFQFFQKYFGKYWTSANIIIEVSVTSEVNFKVTKQPKLVRTKISLKILPGIQKSIFNFFKSKK